MLLLAVAGTILATSSTAAADRPALRASVATAGKADALRSGALRVRVVSRRRARVRVAARVAPRLGGSVAKARRLVLRRGEPRIVKLPLTASGRRLMATCTRLRVGVRARARRGARPRTPVFTGRAGRVRVLRPDPARCPRPTTDWTTWQYDLRGSRFNPTERAITPATVKGLELRWAFGVPDTDGAQSSQPAIVGDRVYVGGRNGVFYALDRRTGRQLWSFDTHAHAPTGLPNPGLFPDPTGTTRGNPLRDGPAVAGGRVYFGDFNGNLYALDARNGKLRWVTEVERYPEAILTSSPLVHGGLVYVGVSSNEVFTSTLPTYPCCRARGSMVAVDARSGKIVWKRYMVPAPRRVGTNGFGVPRYAPSGVSVWSSPALDAETDTLYFGTGQNYTGTTDHADSVVALDSRTGKERWHWQATRADQWTAACLFPQPGGNCPEPGPDFDFGSSPNLFRAGGRKLVGIGQKSGVYHVLDARTGKVVWQTILNRASGEGGAGGQEGIQWGSSYDGKRLYVPTNQANPGTLFALDPATGRGLWKTPSPPDGCSTGGAALSRPGDCAPAMPAAPSNVPGLVFEGGRDGKMRAFSSSSGKILWEYDTVRSYPTVNGEIGRGGSISGGGAAVSRGTLVVNSGYQTANSPFTGISGNVVLAFGLPSR